MERALARRKKGLRSHLQWQWHDHFAAKGWGKEVIHHLAAVGALSLSKEMKTEQNLSVSAWKVSLEASIAKTSSKVFQIVCFAAIVCIV